MYVPYREWNSLYIYISTTPPSNALHLYGTAMCSSSCGERVVLYCFSLSCCLQSSLWCRQAVVWHEYNCTGGFFGCWPVNMDTMAALHLHYTKIRSQCILDCPWTWNTFSLVFQCIYSMHMWTTSRYRTHFNAKLLPGRMGLWGILLWILIVVYLEDLSRRDGSS